MILVLDIVLTMVGFAAIFFTGVMVFKEHDYKFATDLVAIFLLSLIISHFITKLIERLKSPDNQEQKYRVYSINQKECGIVIVSDKCFVSYEHLTDPKTGVIVHPFQRELDLFEKAVFYK